MTVTVPERRRDRDRDRGRGTRVRAGNAMARTQDAIVAAVGACLASRGLRGTTMIDIAAAAGVAKGTLYNHVRTKDEALRLYAVAEVARLADVLARAGLAAVAEEVAAHAVLARLRADEPAVLAQVLLETPAMRPRVVEALTEAVGAATAPLAWRWLSSLAADPGEASERAQTAAQLTQLR